MKIWNQSSNIKLSPRQETFKELPCFLINKLVKLLIPIIILIFIGIIAIGWQIISGRIVKQASQVMISSIDLSGIEDGSYIGEYTLSPVNVIVEVTVKDEQINDIRILEHGNGLGQKAETIIEDVIEKQDLDVDIVARATISSKAVLKAVENALNR